MGALFEEAVVNFEQWEMEMKGVREAVEQSLLGVPGFYEWLSRTGLNPFLLTLRETNELLEDRLNQLLEDRLDELDKIGEIDTKIRCSYKEEIRKFFAAKNTLKRPMIRTTEEVDRLRAKAHGNGEPT